MDQAVAAILAVYILLNSAAVCFGGTLSIIVARRMSNLDGSTRLCMVSLAVADILTIWPYLATFVAMVAQRWPFGNEVCNLSTLMLSISSFASVVFITALSMDRYMVITRPFYFTQEKVQSFFKIAMALIWAIFGITFIISFIIIFFRDNARQEGIYCVIIVNGTHPSWLSVLLLPALGIPMLLICTIYVRLLILGRKHALRIRQQNPNPQPNNAAGSGRRGYKTFAAVTLCFALTSLPYMASVIHARFIASDEMLGSSPTLTILAVCKLIFNSHGWLNALVYVFMNRCFRQEAKKVLKGAWRCIRRQQDHPEP